MWRLAVDPGLHSPGAVIGANDQIVRTARFTPERDILCSQGARCLDIADQIVQWALKIVSGPVEFIFEWPQQYDSRAGKTKGNPNNLTPLAGIGMAIAGKLHTHSALLGDPVTPMPAQWIGQIPKQCPLCERVPGKKTCKVCKGSAWRTPRGIHIRKCVRPMELDIIPDQNDVIDASGIFLWRVGRLRVALPGLVTG